MGLFGGGSTENRSLRTGLAMLALLVGFAAPAAASMGRTDEPLRSGADHDAAATAPDASARYARPASYRQPGSFELPQQTPRAAEEVGPMSYGPAGRAVAHSDYALDPAAPDGWRDPVPGSERAPLLYRGSLGDLLLQREPETSGLYDLGVAFGRQPLSAQRGMMMSDDQVDAIGFTGRHVSVPLLSPGARATAFWGWGNIERGDHRLDRDAQVLGLLLRGHRGGARVDLDAAYVDSEYDSLNVGLGSTQGVQLLGRNVTTSIRLNHSAALDRATAATRNGTLLFGAFSTRLGSQGDSVYLHTFWARDAFRSALRDGGAGGPLAQAGLLFDTGGFGRFGAALPSAATDVTGAAIGRRFAWRNARRQLLLEAGGRSGIGANSEGRAAVGARFQQQLGEQSIWRLDGFVSADGGAESGSGLRTELQTRF